MSATPMVSVLLPIVNDSTWPSSKSVPLLVSHDRARCPTSTTEIGDWSCSAPPIRATAANEAHNQHQDHGARKRHDDLADNRVADDHELDVEEASEEAPEKRSQDANDDVAKDAEPVTQRNAAGRNPATSPTRHQIKIVPQSRLIVFPLMEMAMSF